MMKVLDPGTLAAAQSASRLGTPLDQLDTAVLSLLAARADVKAELTARAGRVNALAALVVAPAPPVGEERVVVVDGGFYVVEGR